MLVLLCGVTIQFCAEYYKPPSTRIPRVLVGKFFSLLMELESRTAEVLSPLSAHA
jgi:hypothetical protein